MKRIATDTLDVAYFEYGSSNASPVILLHGFPYDPHAYDEAATRIAATGKRCIVPFLRGYWPPASWRRPRSGLVSKPRSASI